MLSKVFSSRLVALDLTLDHAPLFFLTLIVYQQSPDTILTKEMCPTDSEEIARMAMVPYKSVLGQLLYISITARPDISTAVSSCGRYSHNPGQKRWNAVLRIVAYLGGTRKLRLILGGCKKMELSANLKLSAASDSDWAVTKTSVIQEPVMLFIWEQLLLCGVLNFKNLWLSHPLKQNTLLLLPRRVT